MIYSKKFIHFYVIACTVEVKNTAPARLSSPSIEWHYPFMKYGEHSVLEFVFCLSVK